MNIDALTVIELLIKKMNAISVITQDEFDICNNHNLSNLSKVQLIVLIQKLFDEHMSLTDVINLTYSLKDVLKEFNK